jgi:isoprenylcysteine carboxyl methyltransferase (ICMT) family protein YpbQ
MFEVLVISGYLLSRLPERLIDGINRKALVHHRIIENRHLFIRFFYRWDLILPAALLLMALNWPLEPVTKMAQLFFTMLVLFGALLRVLAMSALGPLFNLRCQWVKGVEPVESGIYRLFKHPDSLGRCFEAVGLLVAYGIPLGSLLCYQVIFFLLRN